MQARKVEFGDYVVELTTTVMNQQTGEFENKILQRPVDGLLWLKQHLLSPGAQHTPEELMAAVDIVGKIRAARGADEDYVLLETAEWDMLKRVINKLRGYGETDVKMVRRVLKAPLVEMSEKEE
jgi:hypothetical protein